jgi:LuxR family maltose regulon positive regulatory protein
MAETRTRRPTVPSGDRILASKITVPGVPDWAVQRPRITELIAKATRWCPLTVVTGPPGAGKTMALALWAAAEQAPVAWVSLEGHDNRPGVFWPYIVATLRQSGVALPKALPAKRGRAPDHVFLLRLAAALAAQNPPVTLVLDDAHLLTEPKVLDGLHFVLRNVGPGLRLVVTSRMDPLLRLHRYRLAGELTEIRASDLAFSIAEAALLMAQHGCKLSPESLESLTRRTEGWAAGLRLAALSMDAHPDPDQFVKQLAADDSALTGYLIEEVLNAQPPEVREVLLSASILAHFSPEAASELVGNERAGGILQALAEANAFIQSIGCGWYRYHTLFAEVLQLKLRREYPDRTAALHRRAARWYAGNGRLADAVGHAAEAADWRLAADLVIDGLAIDEIIEPAGPGRPSLAEAFRNMPAGGTWSQPQQYLVAAAMALAARQQEPATAALAAAEGMLEGLPADSKPAIRLAAALIRVAVSRRTGDLMAAAAAAARAQMLVNRVPGEMPAQRPGICAQVLSARGTVELWLGHLDEAAELLEAGAAAATAAGRQYERATCLGHLALLEALRDRLGRAAELADHAAAALAADDDRPAAQRPNPAALTALAWVHLQHDELNPARRLLGQVEAALELSPDKPIEAVACLASARRGLADGHPEAAAQFLARARSGWSVPAWLDQRLSLAESQVSVAAGDITAALTAAEQAAADDSLTAAPELARVLAAAGHGENARRALEPVLAGQGGAPAPVRLQAWLVDAQISYDNGDRARGHRSLASAMRLAEAEQIRLPFVLERGWLGQVLRHDPELAAAHRRLFGSAERHPKVPAPRVSPDQDTMPVVVEPLTEREREVLRHVARMLNTAEVASEMYISANTVKTHLKNVYRKLAVAHRSEAVRRARQLELI